MHFIYAPRDPWETQGSMKGYEKWDASKKWAEHHFNQMALSHIARETKDFREKQQAEVEIEIAIRRKVWWERHPNWTREGAVQKLKSLYGIDHTISQQ